MANEKWAICCPGPSLAKYDTWKRFKEYEAGCTVAVNGAIISDTVFDYWVLGDMEVFEAVATKMNLDTIAGTTVLWIPEFWITHVRRFSALAPLFEKFAKETWRNLTFEMSIGYGWPWNNYSLFSAIALAIKKGATIIRAFGADMSGTGYHLEGLTNARTRHIDKRWSDERFWFEQMISLCAKNGITLSKEEVTSAA